MPDHLQQKLHPDDLAAAWQGAPTALAAVSAGGMHSWNDACRVLLREVVGGSELAGRRWLSAAVERLLASGHTREVVTCPGEGADLEVRLGPALPAEATLRVVALRRAAVPAKRHESLAETVSTLSHELRTPLASMKSSLALVLDGETGPVSEGQSRFLGMTMRNINRLERLVSDLLGASRGGAPEASIQRCATDLGPVLRDALAMQGAAARQAGLTLDAAGLPSTLPAEVDPDKVVQILSNVVNNAIKYTPAGGLVRVWVEARPRFRPDSDQGLAWWLAQRLGLDLNVFNLVVEDSGPGMSAEDQDRVFEPWYRGQEGQPANVPGAGLGLPITRSLVEAHGGSIRLASEPGRGTTVWIALPQDSASEELLRGAGQLRALLDQDSERVLAVLDGRSPARATAFAAEAAAAEFQQQQSAVAPCRIMRLADKVVATAVADQTAWNEAWGRGSSALGETPPAWQFLVWRPSEVNKQSMPGLASRKL